MRGLGSMLAIELVGRRQDAGDRARLAGRRRRRSQRGLLLLKAGVAGNCIRVLVPLVISDAELDEALDVWEDALEPRFRAARRGVGSRRDGRRGACPTATSSRSSSAQEECRASIRAHDRLLDRKVALKVLHQQYSDDEEYVERFRREARAVAALSHPNIVTVIDRGEHEGRQFIVFEYVDGENLKRLIERRGPAPVTTALELGDPDRARRSRSRTSRASSTAT